MKKLNLDKNTDNFLKCASIKSINYFEIKQEDNKNPFITIAIPTYKRPKLLEESLLSAINQNPVEFKYEIIVVDNEPFSEGETETALVMEKFKNIQNFTYYRNEENIVAGNWNRCFELAQGEWVALLHDDDLLMPNYLERIFFYLNKKKNCHCLCIEKINFGSAYRPNQTKAKKIEQKLKQCFFKKLIKMKIKDTIILDTSYYSAPTCGTLFKKSSVMELGGFSVDGWVGLDLFFCTRLNKKHPIYKTIEALGYYRWEDNASLKLETMISFVEEGKLLRSYFYETNAFAKKWYPLFLKTYETIAVQSIFKNARQLNKSPNEMKQLEEKYPSLPESNPFKLKFITGIKYCYRGMKILSSIFNG